MFNGALNVQLGGDILKIYPPKLTVMIGVENTVCLFQWCFKNTNSETDDLSSQANI